MKTSEREPDDLEFQKLEEALGVDVFELEQQLSRSDSQTLRRCYCRAVFAHAEGIAGFMKIEVIDGYYPAMLGKGEKEMLEQRVGALMGLFNALDLYTSVAGAETPLVQGSDEWSVLRSAIAIRNRITHPSRSEDVAISDGEMNLLQAARRTLVRLFGESFWRAGAASLKRAAEMRIALELRLKNPGRNGGV